MLHTIDEMAGGKELHGVDGIETNDKVRVVEIEGYDRALVRELCPGTLGASVQELVSNTSEQHLQQQQQFARVISEFQQVVTQERMHAELPFPTI